VIGRRQAALADPDRRLEIDLRRRAAEQHLVRAWGYPPAAAGLGEHGEKARIPVERTRSSPRITSSRRCVRSFQHGTKDGTNKFATAVHHPARSAAPDAAPIMAMERGLKFEIGVDPAHDFGLYLDAAKARLFVRQSARGQRVLNLFSYAGAFGVAAAAGGAIDVANVDPNRDYLTWSLRNAALNGVTMRVLPDKAQDHLARHLRRLARDPHRANYDLVIVDPPAFGIGRGNERVLRLLWPELFASLLAMKPRTLVLRSNDKAFRARQSFVELVEAELGATLSFRAPRDPPDARGSGRRTTGARVEARRGRSVLRRAGGAGWQAEVRGRDFILSFSLCGSIGGGHREYR